MGFHRDAKSGDIHIIWNWEFDTESERLSASLLPTDIGKVALQKDNGGSLWVLLNNNPLIWDKIGGLTTLPDLSGGKVWIGDVNNRPVEIDLDQTIQTTVDQSLLFTTVNVSGDYIASNREFLKVDDSAGNVSITFQPPTNGSEVIIKKVVDSQNEIIVDTVGTIKYQNTTIHLLFDGNSWEII